MPLKQKEPQIEFRDVTFGYPSNLVLDDLSFHIHEGEYVGIIGPNGGGKSTVLKLILGLIKPLAGEIRIFNQPVSDLKNRHMIGYVPQHAAHAAQDFPATVIELVESGRTPCKSPGSNFTKHDHKMVDAALEVAAIKNLKNRFLRELSGGERQRVLVARALAAEPKILILDEPFEGVDINAQQEFYALLKTLNEDKKMTILFVTHDVDVISKQAKELICLNRRLVCQGDPDTVIKKNLIEQVHGKKVTHTHHHG